MMLAQGEAAQVENARWGWAAHTSKMTTGDQGMYRWPHNGPNNDNAHPPIHPTQYAAKGTLQGLEQKLYEFICRSFLACAPTFFLSLPRSFGSSSMISFVSCPL